MSWESVTIKAQKFTRVTSFLGLYLFLFILHCLLIPIPMSDYDIRPGGPLKLKGGVAEGGISKK
jgi:hypothetical protein